MTVENTVEQYPKELGYYLFKKELGDKYNFLVELQLKTKNDTIEPGGVPIIFYKDYHIYLRTKLDKTIGHIHYSIYDSSYDEGEDKEDVYRLTYSGKKIPVKSVDDIIKYLKTT